MIEKEKNTITKPDTPGSHFVPASSISSLLHPFAPSIALPIALPIALMAVLLGAVLALSATVSVQLVAIICVCLCGLAGILLWWAMRWPVVPALQALFLSSLFFRMEINLFPVFKYHEPLPGLLISLGLLVSLPLLIARVIARLRGESRRVPGWPLSFGLVFAFTWLWLSLSQLYAHETWFALCALWSFSANLLMCYVTSVTFANREALRASVIIIAIATGVNGLVGALQTMAGLITSFPVIGAGVKEGQQSIGDGEILRAVGFMSQANIFGWALVTILPIQLALLILPTREFRRRHRLLFAATAALGVTGLIFSFARGSWIAFCLSLPVFVFLMRSALPASERRRYAKRIALGAVLLALLCLPFSGLIYTRLTEDDRGAAYTRKPLMDVALAMIADNPMLGVGLANYEAEMRRYDKTMEGVSDYFDWPVHNIYLHIAAEAGIPAALCFLAMITIALRRGLWALKSRDPMLRALSIGLITGILASLMTGIKELGSIGSRNLLLLYICCGLLLAIDHVRRSDEGG